MHSHSVRRILLVSTLLLGTRGVALAAQEPEPDTLPATQRLPPVEVRVTREAARSPLDLPYAVTTLRPDSTRPGLRNVALDEAMLLLPGVTVSNRHNPTQDPRISIRGFGARSAFGVRGVRVQRDGMPLSLPDGQTPVDVVDLDAVERVDVLRGSASSLYGNAAGGVIELRSAAPPDESLALRLRGWTGTGAFRRGSLSAGGRRGGGGYQATLSRTESDGVREHASHRATHGHARAAIERERTSFSAQLLLLDVPEALNPGALTAAELRADPRAADPVMISKRARKIVRQTQAGMNGEFRLSGAELEASIYGGTRQLDNPLPFAIVDIDRTVYGGGVRAGGRVDLLEREHRWTLGMDASRQNDYRLNFANCNAVLPGSTQACPTSEERGAIRVRQRELVSALGGYARAEIAIASRTTVTAGGRADAIRFDVHDEMGDGSGARTLRALSPMIGAVVRLAPLHSAYATFSSAFETPTATELGNQPDGSPGLNRELEPQRALTAETGIRGVLASGIGYDLSLFSTRVRDELIPYEVPGGGGRRYFRNAGRTQRRGVEAGARATVGSLELGAAYTYSRFIFEEYVVGSVDHAGNDIPGIPRHALQGGATWLGSRGFATLESTVSGRAPLNDANTGWADRSTLVHLRAGLAARNQLWSVQPIIGVNNVLGVRTAAAISINAAGDRYFEPAPGRTFYLGLTSGWGW